MTLAILSALAMAMPLFRAPMPELRDWEDEDEQEEVEVWILPGKLPPAPMDGMPILTAEPTRTRYET